MSGMPAEITTVGELVAALTAYPPQTRVQLAVAPGYPQAATISAIACSPDDADGADGDGRPPDPDAERVVWIGERHPARLPARDRPQCPRPQLDLSTTPPSAVNGRLRPLTRPDAPSPATPPARAPPR